MGEKKVWSLTEPDTLGILYDAEIRAAIDGEVEFDCVWTITLERLTDAEFDALPEFDGH